MASEAPSWADTWGSGGIGDRDEVDNHHNNVPEAKKDGGDAKKKAAAGFNQVKTVTSNGFKWIKNKCQKKKTSTTKEDTT